MGSPHVFCKLLVLLLVGMAVAQDLNQERLHYINRTVSDVMRCTNMPSLSLTYISLNRGSRIVKGYGQYVKNGQSKRVETNNVFCLGGATQAFTSVLLAKLLDVNKTFTWETPIQDIVGHRLALPTQFISSNLNLKDILAMRTGLAGMEIVPVAKPYPRDKLVGNLRFAPRVAGFRDKFIYNEVLFSLLDEVFKTLGGDTWRNLIQTHILEPLNMKSTVFIGERTSSSQEFVNGAVSVGNQPYYLDDNAYSGLELVGPATSLCTTAEDMSRWMQFLLDGGRLSNNVIIRKQALEDLYQPIQPRGRGDPVQQGFSTPANNPPSLQQISYTRDHNSLGWINGMYQGIPFISQDGSLPGYQSLITLLPTQQIAVYVAFTGDQNEKQFAAKVMLTVLGIDQFLQRSSWPKENNICNILENLAEGFMQNRKEVKHAHKKAESTPYQLEEYAGSYHNYGYGSIHVKFNESNDNSLTLEYGMGIYKLNHINNNTFQLIVRSGSLWYTTNADWYRDNQRIYAEFSFHAKDSGEKITTVSIHGFDKHHIPEFSTHAQLPYDHEADQYRCSAPAIAACQFFIMLSSALVYFR